MWKVADLEHNILEILKNGKPTLTPWLCENLLIQANSEGIRMRAAEVLWDLGDRRSVDPLMRAVEADPHEPTKWQATIALSRFADDPKVLAVFKLMSTQDKDKDHRNLALEMLMRWRVKDGTPEARAAEFDAVLKRCRSNFDAAKSGELTLANRLSLFSQEFSDATLREVYNLPVMTARAYSRGGPGAGHGEVEIAFRRAKWEAGAELLHRWTLHPYWQSPSLFGEPRRPPFSHNSFVVFKP